MTAPATATVEIDLELLERLRKRRPAQSDRELVERVARIELVELVIPALEMNVEPTRSTVTP